MRESISRILIAGLLLVFSVTAYADMLNGKVIAVVDGDTITILDSTNTQHKIRLAGIDAPEKSQAFGSASKKSLAEMVFGKQVDIQWSKRDRYGRTVGKVIINGIDANLEQIHRGMAWFYIKYLNEQTIQDRLDYSDAQDYAEKNKLGLWADSNPIPPWDYRKQRR